MWVCSGPVVAAPAGGGKPISPATSGEATGEPAVSGAVVDDQHQPIAGAKVLLATAGVREGTSPLCPSCYPDCAKSAQTDAKGRFRIAGVDDKLVFNVLVAAPGYRPAYARGTDPRKGAVTVKLAKSQTSAQTLRGRVLDPEGRPVFGALVEPSWFDMGNGGSQLGMFPGDEMAVSDKDGLFELTASSPKVKKVGVLIRAPQLARKIFCPQVPGEAVHEYKLDTGVTVRGRLVRDGAPVPNANVCIVQVDRNSRTFLGTQTIGTDVSGKFELTNVPAGDYWTLSAVRDTLPEGTVTGTQSVLTTAPESEMDLPDLAVEKGVTVAGQVILTDGKLPPAETRVLISREKDWDPQTRVVDKSGAFAFTAREGDEITFHARVAGYTDGVDFSNPMDPERTLRVTAAPSKAEIVLEPKGTVSPQKVTTGAVRTPQGEPAAGAKIFLVGPQQTVVVGNGEAVSGSLAETTVNEQGRFVLQGVNAGRNSHAVVLHESGWAEVTLKPGGTINLMPWGRIEGVAQVGAMRVSGQAVKWDMPHYTTAGRPQVFFTGSTTTTKDGSFIFARVHPGTARIGVNTGQRWIMEASPQKVGVVIKGGKTATVKLGGSGATVRGKLDIPAEVRERGDLTQTYASLREVLEYENRGTDRAAQMARECERLERQAEYNFDLKEDGTFVIQDVRPGTYDISVTVPAKTKPEDMVAMPESAGVGGGMVKVGKGEREVVVTKLDFQGLGPSRSAGERVPEFAVKTGSGQALTTSSLKDRAAMVIFSADGDDATEVMRALAALPENKRPMIISSGSEPVEGEAERTALPPWVQTLSASSAQDMAKAFGVQVRPAYYVIAKDGTIAARDRSAEDAIRSMAASLEETR